MSAAHRLLSGLVVALVTLVATQAGASAPVTPGASSGAEPSAAPIASARIASTSRVVAAARKARARSKIVKRNSGWTCTGSLKRIANRNGRGLPLLVKIKFTRHVNIDPGVIDIQGNCHGDGNSNTIDLILKVQGNGRTKGGTFDAIKVHHTPHDIQITGYANCGPRNAIGHQDGAQIMGGDTIYFVNFRWGKWKKRKATCQGAAGTFAPGELDDPGAYPVRNIRLHPLPERLLQPRHEHQRCFGDRRQELALALGQPRRPSGQARHRPDRHVPPRRPSVRRPAFREQHQHLQQLLRPLAVPPPRLTLATARDFVLTVV